MIMSSNVLQFETDLGVDIEVDLGGILNDENVRLPSDSSSKDSELEELELYACWKEQTSSRYGGGSPAPFVPRSQRQYDGDNSFEFCEPFAVR